MSKISLKRFSRRKSDKISSSELNAHVVVIMLKWNRKGNELQLL